MLQPPSETVIHQIWFLYQFSKNKHLCGKKICPTKLSEIQNNFSLILAMKPKQISKIQKMLCRTFETVIALLSNCCITVEKINISMVTIFIQRKFQNFKTSFSLSAIKAPQLNEIQSTPRPSSQTVITQTQLFIQN